jgi:hypothetical protein
MAENCLLSTSPLGRELSTRFARAASSTGSRRFRSDVIGLAGSKAIVNSILLPALAR